MDNADSLERDDAIGINPEGESALPGPSTPMPEQAAPPAPAEDAEVFGDLGQMAQQWHEAQQAHAEIPEAAPATPQERVHARAAKRSAEHKARLEGRRKSRLNPQQADDGRVFAELGQVAHHAAQIDDEVPQPLQTDFTAMERMTFPGEDHSSNLRGTFENFMHEQREWRKLVVQMFQESAEQLRQHRLELDQVRGYLEGGR